MSNEIVPVPEFAVEFRDQTTTALRDLLASQMALTAGHLLRLSWIIRVLEERGEDLSDLRLSILPYLRLIAYGQILPEVVVRFAAFPLLLGKVAALPEPDQKRLGNGENVRLVVSAAEGGGFTTRMLDPSKMTGDQIKQVFGKVGIRSDAEQIAILESRKLKPATARETPPSRGKVRADRQRHGIVVNRTFIPVADAVAAIGDLKATDVPEGEPVVPETTPLSVPLTAEEHKRLKVRAIDGGTTMGALVRDALRMAGLI